MLVSLVGTAAAGLALVLLGERARPLGGSGLRAARVPSVGEGRQAPPRAGGEPGRPRVVPLRLATIGPSTKLAG